MFYIGQDGYSWASSVSGSNACFLYFNSDGLTLQYAYYRSRARQVRCLLE